MGRCGRGEGGGRDGEGVMGVGLMFAMPDCFSYGRGGKGLDVQITARVFVSTPTHRVGKGGHFQPETTILALPSATSHEAGSWDKWEGFNIGMKGEAVCEVRVDAQHYRHFFPPKITITFLGGQARQ